MGRLTLHAHGPADADSVWQGYADPQAWPTWAPQIAKVEADGRLRPGLTGRVWSYLPPPVSFEVLEVDDVRRRWSWRVHLGPLSMRLDHDVTRHLHGTATSVTVHGPWPVLLAYAPLAQVAIRRLVRRP